MNQSSFVLRPWETPTALPPWSQVLAEERRRGGEEENRWAE